MNLIRACILTGSLVLICITGCIGINNSTSRVSNNLYKTFFINDSTELFFIKPIPFSGQMTSLVDFTVKKTNDQFDPVNVKISIIQNHPGLPSYLALYAQGDTLKPTSIKLMFKEKNKKGYLYRYSLTLPYPSIQLFFSAQAPSILVDQFSIPLTRKGAKTINLLNEELFEFNLTPT